MHEMHFTSPWVALFFNHSPNTCIVACTDDIFFVDANTQSMQPFGNTPPTVYYGQHALVLSADDAVLVAGSFNFGHTYVCGYDTASRTQLWIYNNTDFKMYVGLSICSVCTLDQHVLATVRGKLTMVLALYTGIKVPASQLQADGYIFGLGVIEGLLCFFLTFSHPLRPQHFHLSRLAAAFSLQISQGSTFAAGDVGLDCKVSGVASIAVCA
jgi:hypothetical protein